MEHLVKTKVQATLYAITRNVAGDRSVLYNSLVLRAFMASLFFYSAFAFYYHIAAYSGYLIVSSLVVTEAALTGAFLAWY